MEEKVYAMTVEEYGKELVYREFDLPAAKGGEVIVKILACGVCGSDVHVWKGEDKRSHLPMILGHEGIGLVQSVNPGRTDLFGSELQPGDFIVWNRGVTCKNCYDCLVNRKNYTCKQRWSYGFSKSINDYPHLVGAYSSHMRLMGETEILRLLPAAQVDPEADYVPYVSACCAGTTTACAFEQLGVDSGANFVIQGPGPLGIYAVLFAKETGADRIIVIGGTEERLELCRAAGATHTINRHQYSLEEQREMVMELTGGRGGDVVMELAGTAEAVQAGVGYVATGGVYVSAGIAVDVGEVKINWFKDLVRKNATFKGVWVGDMKNTYQAVKVYERHRDVLDRMITHRIPLRQATDALRLMQEKQAIKIALIP